MADNARLEVRKVSEGNIIAFQLNGVLDESFNGKNLADGLKENLILDLSGIKRISSFGIREWLEFLKHANSQCQNIYFIKVPSRLIDQFNMVANFGGKGKILSFYAPYHCDYCELDDSVLLDVSEQIDNIANNKLPDQPCPKCGNAEYLDEDPEAFLSYLSNQAAPEPDPEILAFLSHRLRYSVAHSKQKLKIDKHIGDATYIRFVGDIDSSFPGMKIAAGVEGNVIIDLNGIGEIHPEGAQKWAQMIQMMEPLVENIYIMGASGNYLKHILNPNALANGKVKPVDFFLPYSCTSCNTTTDLKINVDKHYDVLKFATAPELTCPDCGGKSVAKVEEKILSVFSSIQKPNFTKKLNNFVENAKKEIKKSQAAISAPEEIKAKSGLLGIILPLIVLFGIIAGGGWYMLFKMSDKSETEKLVYKKISASMPQKPIWAKTPGHNFKISNGNIVITTSTVEVASTDQGISNAMGWAIDLLVEHMADVIAQKDGLWKTVVRGLYYQPREDLMAKYKNSGQNQSARTDIYRSIAKVHRSMAKSLKVAFGRDIKPSQVYWEKYLKIENNRKIEVYNVWVKLELSEKVVNRMIKSFSTRAEFEGVTLVNFFPGLNWAYTDTVRGVIVLSMKPKSIFNSVLKTGWIINQMGSETIRNFDDFIKQFAIQKKLGLEKKVCSINLGYKYWNNEVKISTQSNAVYSWKCPSQAKTIIKYVPSNGGKNTINTGFQGNVWDDPNQ